jgi:hypothetical protein
LARQDVGSILHLAVSVICRNDAIRSPRVVMMWAKAASTAEPPSRAGPSTGRAPPPARRRLTGVPAEPDRVNAAVIDIPYAVVRRHLIARQAIPASADAIVEDCARALIPARRL